MKRAALESECAYRGLFKDHFPSKNEMRRALQEHDLENGVAPSSSSDDDQDEEDDDEDDDWVDEDDDEAWESKPKPAKKITTAAPSSSSMPSSKPVKRLIKRTPLPINNNDDDDDVEEVDHDGNLVAQPSTAVKAFSPDVLRIAVSLQTIRFAITFIDSLTNLSIIY